MLSFAHAFGLRGLCASLLLLALSLAPAHSGEVAAVSQKAAQVNNLGVAYLAQQRNEDALRLFQKAFAADGSLAIAHMNAGIALLGLGRLPEAKAELLRATEMDPTSARAWYSLGLLGRAGTDCDASIHAFHESLRLAPDDADAHYFLGGCYADKRDYAKAAEEYREAIRLAGMYPSAEFGLARVLQRTGETEQARAHLSRFQHIVDERLAPVITSTYGSQGAYSLAQEIHAAEVVVQNMIPLTLSPVKLADSPGTPATRDATVEGHGDAFCLIDVEGHGRPDVLVADGNGVRLYRRDGKGRLAVVNGASLGLAEGAARSCAIGDVDGDGHSDVAVAYNDAVRLYRNTGGDAGRNTGDSTGKLAFEDWTARLGSGVHNRPSGLLFVDFDHDGDLDLLVTGMPLKPQSPANVLWRNNGNGTFTDWTSQSGLGGDTGTNAAVLSDLNNDRAVDVATADGGRGVTLYMNPREGKFLPRPLYPAGTLPPAIGLTVVDYNKDGWMDLAVTHAGAPGLTLWRNRDGQRFERVPLSLPNVSRGWDAAAVDIDNDGWIDLALVAGRGEDTELRVLRNLGPGGFSDITETLGPELRHQRGLRDLVAFDVDGDGDTDLLASSAQSPPVLLRNDGGNRNHSVTLALRGMADNKTALGTKVELSGAGLWQKWEVNAASGNTILAGLGDYEDPLIVRLLWPTGVPQDETDVAPKGTAEITELDRRGSSCPVLFAWDGDHYTFVTDTIGAAVVGHWIAPGRRNTPDPDEWIKVDGSQLQQKDGYLSLRLGEPMEEVNYIDQMRLLAVDHPAGSVVFPNERFRNHPPFAANKIILARHPYLPRGAWNTSGNDVLTLLRESDHQYVHDFRNLPYAGFANRHSLTLDLGTWSPDRPLRLLMRSFIEYFSASSLYAAWQAGRTPVWPAVDAQMSDGSWRRVIDDMGFPAGLPRTIVVDLTGRLPRGVRRIRITTNLQIYWDQVLISNEQDDRRLLRETPVPLASASLAFHGYPRQIAGRTAGDLTYDYNQASATGPFVPQRGAYTNYGSVTPLLTQVDDRSVVFATGEDIDTEFRASALPPLPNGWIRDYFVYINGYVKDMDYYEATPYTVDELPFHGMPGYPYGRADRHSQDEVLADYLLEWNNRLLSGAPAASYRFDYQPRRAEPLTPLPGDDPK